ncbi:MAG: hypothetical protein HY273_06635 [Gammaproteobacteria bacterium]|nr:hypothetical protein [Gammaproteobacteria bacterium]
MATFYKIVCALLLAGLTAGHVVGWSVVDLVQSKTRSASHSANITHK